MGVRFGHLVVFLVIRLVERLGLVPFGLRGLLAALNFVNCVLVSFAIGPHSFSIYLIVVLNGLCCFEVTLSLLH